MTESLAIGVIGVTGSEYGGGHADMGGLNFGGHASAVARAIIIIRVFLESVPLCKLERKRQARVKAVQIQ